jgi:hypothetical protein
MTATADPDEEHLTALVIGAKDVLVCTSGEKRGTNVMATRLADLRSLADRLGVAGAKVPDDGMSVNGFPACAAAVVDAVVVVGVQVGAGTDA